MKSIKNVFAILACLALYLPLIVLIFNLEEVTDQDFEKTEKRKREKNNIRSFESLPSDIEKWFNDNYGLRSSLIEAYAEFKFNIFNDTINSQNSVAGRSGYLFLGNKYNRVIDQSRNTFNFSEKNLNCFIQTLIFMQSTLKSSGVQFHFSISPNKHSIYPEFGPAYFLKKAPLDNAYSQLTSRVLAEEIPFTELKGNLVRLKEEFGTLLYSKTDTHWSNLGAYKAYEFLMNDLKKANPALISYEIGEYNVVPSVGYDLVQISKLDSTKMYDYKIEIQENGSDIVQKQASKIVREFIDSDRKVLSITNKDALNDMKVLVYRDSFTNRQIPFLTKSFRQAVYIHHHHILHEKYGFEEQIKQVKPDAVLFLIVERAISTKFKSMPKHWGVD